MFGFYIMTMKYCSQLSHVVCYDCHSFWGRPWASLVQPLWRVHLLACGCFERLNQFTCFCSHPTPGLLPYRVSPLPPSLEILLSSLACSLLTSSPFLSLLSTQGWFSSCLLLSAEVMLDHFLPAFSNLTSFSAVFSLFSLSLWAYTLSLFTRCHFSGLGRECGWTWPFILPHTTRRPLAPVLDIFCFLLHIGLQHLNSVY